MSVALGLFQNNLEISCILKDDEFVINIVGGDDRRVLIWNTEKCIANCCIPTPMNGQHHSNIFCLAFDSCSRRVFSGGTRSSDIKITINS